jgi:hypothetical protein
MMTCLKSNYDPLRKLGAQEQFLVSVLALESKFTVGVGLKGM